MIQMYTCHVEACTLQDEEDGNRHLSRTDGRPPALTQDTQEDTSAMFSLMPPSFESRLSVSATHPPHRSWTDCPVEFTLAVSS